MTEPEMTAEEQPVPSADEPVEEQPVAAAPEPTEAETQPLVAEQATPTEPEATADEPVATAHESTTPDEQPAAAADEQPAAEADEQPAAEADEQHAATAEASEAAPEALAAEPEAEAAPAVPARQPKGARQPKAAAEERRAATAAPEEEATAPAAAPAPAGPRGLRVRYRSEVVPALVKQFEYANPNQVPKLEKIVVNIGLGEALSNAKAIDAASSDLTMITGQKPIVTKAKRSIAQFRVRAGNPIGLKVTLRGQRMWDFLERLLLLTLPRIRDFRGLPSRSFDGRGNYSLGMGEQIAFPEIDYDKVDRIRGLEVSIVTTAKSDEESKRLLELLGMPFAT
jgi:large subunit ribosomal protein L5